MVLEARIASLEDRLARAIVLDAEDAAPGVVAIGSSVLIEDLASGALSRYRLASAHHSLGPDTISVASPIGQALIGSVPGTTVTVELPSGRSRSVRLVDVESEGPARPRPRAAAGPLRWVGAAVLAHAPKGEHEAEAAARDRRLLVSDDHDARRRVMGELARDAAEQEALEA